MFKSNSGRRRDNGATGGMSGSSGKRGMFSVIGQDVTITGNIVAASDLHIDGRIEGDVDCGTLVLGAEGRIAGNVRADNARLAGTIIGGVVVRELVVERGARITGDVEYHTISIDNGATVDGRLKHFSPGEVTSIGAPSLSSATATVLIAHEAAQ